MVIVLPNRNCLVYHWLYRGSSINMKVKDLIELLNTHDLNKDLVIYSNENDLKDYGFIGTYENEGQVELHVNEGKKL